MPTTASSDKYVPGQTYKLAKSTAERFRDLNAWIMKRGGWITSIPGEQPAVIECLQGSFILTDLDAAGYEITPIGGAERILPGAIVTTDKQDDGTTITTRHAGITATFRYEVRY
ncbi:hypothetical protein [Bradyrhizobium sp. HKCCYLS20291]|uniref:hypothetical protein n=1 Tax=Bradyrhizobium sp. HKCCYLS20291 TaxID=3420766 RepID=UPI003EB6C78F